MSQEIDLLQAIAARAHCPLDIALTQGGMKSCAVHSEALERAGMCGTFAIEERRAEETLGREYFKFHVVHTPRAVRTATAGLSSDTSMRMRPGTLHD